MAYIMCKHIPAYSSTLKTEGTPAACHNMSDIVLNTGKQIPHDLTYKWHF